MKFSVLIIFVFLEGVKKIRIFSMRYNSQVKSSGWSCDVVFSAFRIAFLCLVSPPVSHFIDIIWTSKDSGGGALRKWAGIILNVKTSNCLKKDESYLMYL